MTILLCLFPLLAHAAIYTYVDDSGTSHFTNMVPIGKKFRVVISERIRYVVSKVFNNTTYDGIIERHAQVHGIDPFLIKAVMKAESNFNPNAMSHKGAQGLMQLMPDTARLMNVGNPFDPDDNIRGGTKYLKYLDQTFNGNLDLVLAAYNAGPQRVKEYNMNIPPYDETRTYVQRVKSYYQSFKKN
ncbi:MAG: transglycosylase SLT domain-containing protein [Syntrophorhabdaceae bacterium]